MIRAQLGDELFWQAIQTFIQDNAHKTVETVDLLRAIEKATGRNLLFLFDQYVYRGGHPDFKVAYSWDGDAKLAKITVTQTQAAEGKNGNKDLFDLKIPIGFGYTQQKEVRSDELGDKNHSKLITPNSQLKTFTVRVNEREQSFYFPLENKPQFISFDVGNDYLKTVTLDYSIPELKAQLEFDPDPISRIYAATALAKKGGLEAIIALSASLKNDPLWGVRVEVAKQLAKINLDQAFDGLVLGLKDKNAYVRRSVVEALAQIKTAESYKVVKGLLQKGDPSYYVEAAASRVIGAMSATGFAYASANLEEKPKEDKVLKLLKGVLEEKAGWNEVVRSGAVAGLAEFKTSEAALNLLIEYTKLGVPQPLRLATIRALGKISVGQSPVNLERILEKLTELAKETFFLTQVAVAAALGQMETPKAVGILRSLAEQTADGRVRRYAEEEISKVQKNIGSEKTLRQLREDFDQLKQQNQELRSRLENLEAKSK